MLQELLRLGNCVASATVRTATELADRELIIDSVEVPAARLGPCTAETARAKHAIAVANIGRIPSSAVLRERSGGFGRSDTLGVGLSCEFDVASRFRVELNFRYGTHSFGGTLRIASSASCQTKDHINLINRTNGRFMEPSDTTVRAPAYPLGEPSSFVT